jgi:hypothetical protein
VAVAAGAFTLVKNQLKSSYNNGRADGCGLAVRSMNTPLVNYSCLVKDDVLVVKADTIFGVKYLDLENMIILDDFQE